MGKRTNRGLHGRNRYSDSTANYFIMDTALNLSVRRFVSVDRFQMCALVLEAGL